MPKRQHHSIEEACITAYGILGVKASEAATGKVYQTLYKWADPEEDGYRIPLHQALALDRACILAGDLPPFMALHRHVVQQAMHDSHIPIHPTDRALEVMASIGELADELRACVHPEGDGGRHITDREAGKVEAMIETLEATLQMLRKDVREAVRSAQVHPIRGAAE